MTKDIFGDVLRSDLTTVSLFNFFVYHFFLGVFEIVFVNGVRAVTRHLSDYYRVYVVVYHHGDKCTTSRVPG